MSPRSGHRFAIRLIAFLVLVSIVAAGPVIPIACIVHASEADDDGIDWAKERRFWSFHAPVPQSCPQVKNKSWPHQPLDYFILSRLEREGLSPLPAANRRTLIRRVTFDLTGLPPTPAEVDAFLKDSRADAYGRLVERLLASPRFGERMASLWMPLARYAEDQAHQVGSDTKFFYPNAYKYREWVIHAFNRDLPYDEFIRLQLAADKFDAARADDLAALGFLGLGPKYYNRNRLDVMSDEWEDRVDTVTRTTLGLTVACARCHDHKFEPITMRDYYALAGVFASTRMVNKGGDGQAEDSKTEAAKLSPDTLHIVEDGEATNLTVFLRGNVERKGPVTERRFLRLLSEGEPSPFAEGSGRKELALAIADRRNPLTARVMANRLWGTFFGRPLVRTESNFGHSGDQPTHLELLDDMAARFMDKGWSIKSLVREIVLSSTYRQSSFVGATMEGGAGRAATSRASPRDAANEWLGRMNRRRLAVEQWRDAVLFASGGLDFTAGQSLELDDANNNRRTVYARISRLKLNDFLMLWDYPDANVHAEKRSVTTTATQKLFVLNSPFMLAQAKALAERLTGNPKESDAARVDRAYLLLFSRPPERLERNLALEFLRKPTTTEMTRWEQYAQMLLASNEMLYVD